MVDIVERVRIEGDADGYAKAVEQSKMALNEFTKHVTSSNKKMAASTEQKATKQTKAEESIFKSMLKSQLALKALDKAYSVLSNTVNSAIADAAEYERTTIARNTALEMSGRAVEKHAGFLEIEAGQLQGVTGASDEVIRKMQTQAIAFGVSTTKTRELIEASYGLANATGMDVNTAFIQLQKST